MQVGSIIGGIGQWSGLLHRLGERDAEPTGVRFDGLARAEAVTSTEECETCKNRRYQDVSNDPSVSFQTAQRLAPGAEYAAVRSHEQEHVVNEQTKAEKEGREVVAQSVTIHYAVCPECGRVYVAGGTTSTTTAKARESKFPYDAVDPTKQATGRLVDRFA